MKEKTVAVCGLKVADTNYQQVRNIFRHYIPVDYAKGFHTFWFRSDSEEASKVMKLAETWKNSKRLNPYCLMTCRGNKLEFEANNGLAMTVYIEMRTVKGGGTQYAMPWGYENYILKQLYGWGDSSSGLLNFTNEGEIRFSMKDGKPQFEGGWELNCGSDWNWDKSDSKEFESRHPGMLHFIEELMNDRISMIKAELV